MYNKMVDDLEEDFNDLVQYVMNLGYDDLIKKPYNLILYHQVASLGEKFTDFICQFKEEHKE